MKIGKIVSAILSLKTHIRLAFQIKSGLEYTIASWAFTARHAQALLFALRSQKPQMAASTENDMDGTDS